MKFTGFQEKVREFKKKFQGLEFCGGWVSGKNEI